MLFESYDSLDWYWDYLSFQPPMLSYREFRSVEGCEGYDFRSVGVMFSSNNLFVMDMSETADVDTWVHEFVEIALAGVITKILGLRPFTSIPVHLLDERLGWRFADFCHWLAALTTGQGWLDKEDAYYSMEADDVWLCVESAIKNNLKDDVEKKKVKNNE